MIFRQWQQVLDGTKTQTRRVKGRDEVLIDDIGVMKNGRMKHRWHRSYPIIPKRGQKAIGRFRITWIVEQNLQCITEEDARAEGVASVEEYRQLWESINGKTKGARWADNPVVFVYTIQNVTRPADTRDMYDPINFN